MKQLHKKHIDVTLTTTCLLYLLVCTTNGVATGTRDHFVLVHGAGHGAWCWFKLIPLLRSSGQRVTALDMAASGIDTQEANNLRSVADYFQPLADFMATLPLNEKVILVGHSYGGFGLTYSMELFPEKIAAAVFVTAIMPGPTLNASTVNQKALASSGGALDSTFSYNNGPDNPPTSLLLGPLLLATRFYQLSPVNDLALANLLIRRFPLFTDENLSKVIRPTNGRYGRVKRAYIVSGRDLGMEVSFQEWMIQRNPPDEVLKVDDSDHMAMFSKPAELSALLLGIASRYT
ncbi:hypothetical protein MLD38_013809 [Melastoma candidum]|uniref:Uncharacterized protein n=1 Tax=Melastoma candidum TaxID=119954 RepID=A0ACB9REY3_9MYRT|nr:hypothetical protein MLD38_013809 [Melastoma candidum]